MARTVLLTGYREFIEKYLETAGDLLARNHAVLCLDWRGQGLSERPPGDAERNDLRSMDLLLTDLLGILAASRFLEPSRPVFLIAHSMGGHLALRAVLELPLPVDRVVLLAPMIDIPLTGMARRLAAPAAHAAVALGFRKRYLPGAGGYRPLPFANNVLTGDARRFARTAAMVAREPRLALGGPTFAWLTAALTSIDTLDRSGRLAGFPAPVLLLQAGHERVVSNPAQNRLLRQLPDARLHLIPEARHEILQETDDIRAQAWARIDRFLAP